MSAVHTPTKPTQGDWHVAEWTCHAKSTVLVDCGPEINIVGKHMVADCDTAETARLVAAAPELLAAVRKSLGVLSGADMNKQALIDALALCHAALSKAAQEGGEA